MVATIIGAICCALTLSLHFFLLRTYRKSLQNDQLLQSIAARIKAVDAALKTIEERFKVDEEIKSRRQKLENKSVELQEFLADMMEHGCGLIRISPDAVFIRGYKK